MNQFLLSLTGILAWPAVIIVLALVLRREMRKARHRDAG